MKKNNSANHEGNAFRSPPPRSSIGDSRIPKNSIKSDKRKNKEQLIMELAECRRHIEDLKESISMFGPSEDVFNTMGNSMQMGIYIIQDDKTIFTNSHISSYSGYSPDELKRLSLMRETVHPEDQKRVREYGIRMLKGIDPTPYEYRIITKDGNIKWLVEKVTSIRYQGKRAILGNTMDITHSKKTEEELLKIKGNLELIVRERTKELLDANASLEAEIGKRKQVADALRDSEEVFRALAEYSLDTIMRFDLECRHLYVNPNAERETGIPRERFIGRTHKELGFPDDLVNLWEEAIRKVIATGRHNRIEFQLPKGIWIDWLLVPEFDERGRVKAVMTSARDITGHKKTEEALTESERRYRLITEKMSDIVWIADMNLMTFYITPSVYNVLGYTQEEVMALSPGEMMTPDSFTVAMDTFARELALEEQGMSDPDRKVKLDLDYYHRDGSIRCLETVISAIRDENGVLTALHGVSRDITEQKHVREKLKETMDILGEAQRIAHIGSWEWDIRQNKIWYSDELRRIFEIHGQEKPISLPTIFNSIKPEYRLMVEKAIEVAIENRVPFNVEYKISTRNRPERVLQSQGKVFYDSDGKAVRIVGITKDVTQEKILERQVIHREKLASLGLMISGIAHEVNNSNNFIVFNIPILRDYVTELLDIAASYAKLHPDYSLFGMTFPEFKTDIIKLIDNLDHGAHRINSTISNLRDFTSRKVQQRTAVDVASAIESAEKICHNQITMSVKRFEKYIEPDIPKLMTDGEALEQIIVNLLINAVHALDKEDSEIRINAKRGKTWHEHVIVEVTDNGSGIEPKAIDNLFDPFFTTKPFHKGMGLGLYMVKNMLEGMGGRIEVASEPGKGSTFRIILADIEIH